MRRLSKLELIDKSLFLYGGLVTIILTITAFFNLNSTNSLIAFIILLPVTIYFAVQIILKSKLQFQKLLNTGQKRHPYFGNFSLTTFINQSEPTFLVNLVLITFAVFLILFRISFQILK